MRKNNTISQIADLSSLSFESFFRKHDAIMLLMESGGRLIDVNDAALRFYGYSLKQMKKMKIGDINMLSPKELKAELQRAVREEKKYFIFPHKLANGKIRTVEVHTSCVLLAGKKFLFSIIHDITERKRAEELNQNHIKFLEAINEYASGLVYLQYDEIFPYAAKHLKSIFSVKVAWISRYDENPSSLVIKSSSLTSDENSKLMKLLGGKAVGYKIPVTQEQYRMMTKNPTAIVSSLHELSFGAMPQMVSKSIEKIFGIEWFMPVVLIDRNKLIGTAVIAGGFGQEAPNREEIISFAAITANALHCKQAEETLKESENNYRNLVENTLDIIYSMNNEGCITFITPNVSNYGYTPEDFIGHNLQKFIHPDDIEEVLSAFNKALETGVGIPSVFRFFRKTGDIIWLEEKSLLIKENGKLTGFVGVIRDITERKQVEAHERIIAEMQTVLLRSCKLEDIYSLVSEKVFLLLDNCITATSMLNESNRTVRMAALHGVSIPFKKIISALGMDPRQKNISLDDMTEKDLKIYRSGKLEKLEGGIYTLLAAQVPKSACRLVEKMLGVKSIYTMGFTCNNAHLGGLIILARNDITPHAAVIEQIVNLATITIERKQTEEKLRESEEIFSQFMSYSPVHVYIKDNKLRLIKVSNSFKELLGKPIGELLGKDSYALLPPDFAKSTIADDLETLKAGKVVRAEEMLNGRVYTTIKFPINRESGKSDYLGGFSVDITEHKQMEKALIESQNRLILAVKSAELGVWDWDIVNNKMIWDDQMYRLYGITDKIKYSGIELWKNGLHPDDFAFVWEECQAVMRGERKWDIEFRVLHPDGKVRFLKADGIVLRDKSGKAIRMIGVNHDITARKTAEEKHQKLEFQIQQNQKLESLGILAGGIAHDFNNLLSIIYGNLQLMGMDSDAKEREEYIGKCLQTIKRAKGITGQLLTFAKGGAPIKRTGSLMPFLKNTVKFALSGSNCLPDFKIEEGLWALDYDENQMGQVFDNIVINAVQAMPNGGRLKISAQNIILEKGQHPSLEKGNYVKVSVKDSGIGMSSDTIAHIFDPYFTTKAAGRGLGLTSVFSIVKKHDGHIDAESIQGKGSVFHIYLPASKQPVIAEEARPASVLKKTGKILIMDDEKEILNMLGRILKSLGCTAVGVSNGEEVIKLLLSKTHKKDPFTAVILDLTIPGGMGGKETVAKIRKFAPDLPVFVSSGYSSDPVMADPKKYGFTGSLVKPFEQRELIKLLNTDAGD